MPDASDVARALVALVSAAISGLKFPSSTATQWTARPALRGWPLAARLASDIGSKQAEIFVYERPGMSRDVTRYPTEWHGLPGVCTLTASVLDTTATFAGTCALGQIAAALVDRTVYPYRVADNDTPSSVAQAIGQQIAGAIVSGPTITAVGLKDARTGQDSAASRETRRQQQSYMVTIWCADPVVRDAVAAVVDAALAGLTDANDNIRPFFDVADGTQVGPLHYEGSASIDKAQNADVYRRDLYYRVEYPTVQQALQPVMLFPGLRLFGQYQVAITAADGTPLSGADGESLRNTDEGDVVVQGLVNLAAGTEQVLLGADGAPLLTTADGG